MSSKIRVTVWNEFRHEKMLDDDTRDLLHEIIRRGNTQSHIDWAVKRLAEMKAPPPTSNTIRLKP